MKIGPENPQHGVVNKQRIHPGIPPPCLRRQVALINGIHKAAVSRASKESKAVTFLKKVSRPEAAAKNLGFRGAGTTLADAAVNKVFCCIFIKKKVFLVTFFLRRPRHLAAPRPFCHNRVMIRGDHQIWQGLDVRTQHIASFLDRMSNA
jgi:hypothetical protein